MTTQTAPSLDQHADTRSLVPFCPDWVRDPLDTYGCSSLNVSEPHDDGTRDCFNCGIYFEDEDAYGHPDCYQVLPTPNLDDLTDPDDYPFD